MRAEKRIHQVNMRVHTNVLMLLTSVLISEKKFTQHFNTIAKLGKDDTDFKHHCKELQSWYDAVRVIRLKESNKNITRSQLWDWFFTVGQDVEDVILPQFIDLYEDFYQELSRGNRKVVDILEELL